MSPCNGYLFLSSFRRSYRPFTYNHLETEEVADVGAKTQIRTADMMLRISVVIDFIHSKAQCSTVLHGSIRHMISVFMYKTRLDLLTLHAPVTYVYTASLMLNSYLLLRLDLVFGCSLYLCFFFLCVQFQICVNLSQSSTAPRVQKNNNKDGT